MGQGGFVRLLRAMPEVYREWEENEERLRALLGDVSILKDRRGGALKPLTLKQLREREQRADPIDLFDIGGCGCFLDEDDRAEMKKVIFYTDGSCEGTVKKPGAMGAGVVAVMDTQTEEFAIPLGHGTNQQAELLAVREALALVPPERRPTTEVLVKTDSRYAIGCLTENWNVVANREIVLPIRRLAAEFGSFRMEHVPGHAGYSLNERAHSLAKEGRLREKAGCAAPLVSTDDVPATAQVELERGREVIAHLVSALQWYADPLAYLSPPGDDDAAPSIVSDRGATARATLAQLGFGAVADPFS